MRITDQWASWLLERRHGGDAALHDRVLRRVGEFRDRVLDGAEIAEGDTVLDVGCGDGLLGVGALGRVADEGTVIFSDVSTALLERCREIVTGLGAVERCRFVATGLPDLGGIADGEVDVAMTRSVLIYVKDKEDAFRNLRRVLRDGGRLSIFEPINRFSHPEPDDVLFGFDVSGLEALAGKVKDAYRRHQPDLDPMTDFDERDLLDLAVRAGFTEVHLEYRADVGPDPMEIDLAAWSRMAPNPLVPTMGETLAEALEPGEREVLLARMAEQVGAGVRRRRGAVAYLTARR